MEDLSRRQKQVLALLLAGVLLGTGSLLYQHLQRGPVEIFPVTPVAEPWPEEELRGEVVVHVCGAVVTPGIYRLPVGSRVYQALEAAGGALPGARVDLLNLASLLRDGERIRVPAGVPASGEKTQVLAGAPASGDREFPAPSGDAPAPVTPTPAATAAKEEPRATGESMIPRPGMLIDPNTASSSELQTIPGIGPVLATRIIEYRETVAPFTRPEDLLNVSGIGAKTLEKIVKYLEFGGP
ncbi:MAG: ComEA family DNA-binding protein [Firmicutes bacterium]|nr:ComEA family DNA-binding protein [Bacillota bacterium]